MGMVVEAAAVLAGCSLGQAGTVPEVAHVGWFGVGQVAVLAEHLAHGASRMSAA